jgi:class 3 adenylate cyclase
MTTSTQPAERRLLTVMFADLVGSTALASRLDPEDWREILVAYQEQVAKVIESFGGRVTQFQGDGVVAYFGWPHASDTSSRDAVSAGLAIVDAVPQVGEGQARVLDRALAARVGIHTGLVVIAAAETGGVTRTADVFGETPSLASRLQALAGSGEVVISDATARLVAGWFQLEPLGPTAVRGFDRAIPVYRVLARLGTRSALEAKDLSPFVGRRAEIGGLLSHWHAARLGRVRTVLLLGEPGIGKSRLAREFAALTESERTVSLLLHCSRQHRLTPLFPFAEVTDDPPVTSVEAAAWIMSRVRDRPSLLVIEDVQWADPSTVEVLGLLESRSAPLLILLTARTREDPSLFRYAHTVVLGPLAIDEASAIIEGVSRQQLRPEVRDRLVARGGGVPLFLEELARANRDGTEGASAGRSGATVPVTLSETLTARIDRLGDAKRMAQMASVVGHGFDTPTLAALAGVGDDVAARHLESLIDNGIIVLVPGAHGPRYDFRHALVQEAAYESLLRADRRAAHGAVADLLQAKDPEAAVAPEAIAFHLGLAGRFADAATKWESAGRAAARSTRFKEAAGHLREALACLPELPDSDQRDAIEVRVRGRLAQYIAATDQAAPEVRTHLQKGLELAARRHDGLAVVEGEMTLAAHYQAVADYPAIHLALDLAEGAAVREGIEWILPSVGLMRGAVLVWEGRLAEGRGVLGAAIEGMGLSFHEAPALSPTFSGLAVDIVVAGYVMAGLADWLAGRADQGMRLAGWGSDLATALGSPHAQCLCWSTTGIIHQLAGDADAVRNMAVQTLSLADDLTTAQFREWAEALLHWADGELVDKLAFGHRPEAPFMRPYLLSLQADRISDSRQALVLIDEALALAEESGERFAEAQLLMVRAERQVQIGERERGSATYARAVAVARAQGAVALEERAARRQVELGGR